MGGMKSLSLLLLGAAVAVLLSSCGECACNSYNKDYLRDVPVTTHRSFYH